MLTSIPAKWKNLILTRLKAWGPSRIQRYAWNREFAKGHWDFIDSTPDDKIYSYLERYCRGGALLDLGCGSGNTGTELREACYREYVGVDISDVAVEKARTRSAQAGRASRNSYVQGDVTTYTPDRMFDVILFRESIWYIPKRELTNVLCRYRKHLNREGVFIVRMYDRNRLADIVEILRNHTDIVEESAAPETRDVILVFR